MPTTTTLDRDAWIEAAIAAWSDGGLERVAVEPLARSLGATKGSFYWHFRNRAELVRAVLEYWESEATLAIIDIVRGLPDEDRIAALLTATLAAQETDRAEWMILAAADHPLVAPVVTRVHETRLSFLTELLVAAGTDPARAEVRAKMVYSVYIGQLHLRHGTPQGEGEEMLPPIRDEIIWLLVGDGLEGHDGPNAG